MDRVKRTQIQVRKILRDYYGVFSKIESREELVSSFRSLFKDTSKYWKHLVKHAVPRKVVKELQIDSWKKASRLSRKLLPYQINYAIQFIDTLGYIEIIVTQELPGSELKRIIFFSSKNRMAVVFESSGEVATVFELDKFKSWEEWKNHNISRGIIIEEVSIDEDIRRLSLEIRKSSKKLFEGS
jgi:hypothetical protein